MPEKIPCPVCEQPVMLHFIKRHGRAEHGVELRDEQIPASKLELQILKALAVRAMDRGMLVNRLKQKRTTIYDALMRLVRKGRISQKREKRTPGAGRPREMFFRPGITSWDGNLDTRL